MEHRTVGFFVIAAGAVAVLVGLFIFAGGLSWVGRLPGDIRVEVGTARISIPVTSMLLLSLALSLLFYLVRRLL